MDRRKSIKALVVGTFSSTLLIDACKPGDKKGENTAEHDHAAAGDKKVDSYDEAIMKKVFLDEHEMKTITVLANIIIPADDHSGNAEEAGVPGYIHFMSNDNPNLQTPLRGGIKWMDMQCVKRYNNSFVDSNETQKLELVEEIAWPEKAKPEMGAGVAFFNLMRNLTASGFWSSKVGVKDIGYMGNVPNQWNGAPKEVLDKLGVAYDEKMLKECLNYDTA
ncbi:MAG: gluconate 2-dehydrogenase subunit 3 family protein [Chitinophagaceae bacterium]